MERLIIPEQDIINAICVFSARKSKGAPEDVEVELIYDDEVEDRFSAEVFIDGQKQMLGTVDIIVALRLWIDEFLNRDPFAAAIELQLDEEEGILAVVQ